MINMKLILLKMITKNLKYYCRPQRHGWFCNILETKKFKIQKYFIQLKKN